MTDKYNPYSYKQWLSLQQEGFSEDPQTLYTKYLKNWYVLNTKQTLTNKEKIKDEYLQLIKDISYLFNEEEKNRFLKDIDYSNPEELIYAIPYFAQKLKEISKVLNAKRNSVKNAKLKYSLAGSNNGLETLLYEYILKTFTRGDNSITQIPAVKVKETLPSLSSIKDDFYISIEELYDTKNYFDSDPSVNIQNYENLTDFLNEYPFEELSEDEILGILQTRFIPHAANNTLSKVYQAYVSSLSADNFLNFNVDEDQFGEPLTNTTLPQTRLFDLQVAASEKYLGESVYGLTAIRVRDLNLPDQLLNLGFETGNNWFIWPSGVKIINPDLTDNYLKPIPLNESNFVNSGATGGGSIEDSDLIFTDRNGIVEGAWLMGPRTITEKTSTSLTIFPNDVREFLYPYVGFNVTTKGLNWAGHSLNDESFLNFEILPTEQKRSLLGQYYTENIPPSASEPIYLNQTTLVDQKAFAGEFSNSADLIIKRNNTNSLDEIYSDTEENKTEVAFLYKFQKTDLPIALGLTQIYWPLKTFNSNENIPLTIKTNHSIPVRLSNLKIAQTMSGAIAGTNFDTADVIYRLDKRTQEPIEAAWLASASIQSLDTSANKAIKIYDTDAVKCAKYIDGPIQPTLAFKANAGSRVSFVWMDVDTPADDVFKNYEHAPNCPYGKNYPHDYHSNQDFLNPSPITELNHWKNCNCKSIYYSPIGHIGDKITDYNTMTDLLYADPDGLGEDFSFESWTDTRGLRPSQSPQFAFFKLRNGDSPVGFGRGNWKTGNNKQFILKTGRRYTYYRTTLRKDTTSSTVNGEISPFYVQKYSYQEIRGLCSSEQRQTCFDLVVVLDISNSQSLSLGDTKQIVSNIGQALLQNASGQSQVQIGLIAFNRETYNISYLTNEFGVFDFNLNTIEPVKTSPQYKTNIGDALELADVLLFNKIPADATSTINITDLCRNLNAVIVDDREISKTFNFPQSCPKKVLILSDGVENINVGKALIKSNELKEKNVEIYSVDAGLLSKNNNLMEQIATSPNYYYDFESYSKEGEGDAYSFSQKIIANVVGCASIVPAWYKAIRGSDGTWIGLNESSDMVLNPGDFLIYIHRDGAFYESEDVGSGFLQNSLSFSINVKLNGWDYTLHQYNSAYVGDLYGARPFWAVAYSEPNLENNFQKELNYFGGHVRYFNDYVPIKQPEVSPMIIENNTFLQYYRRDNFPLNWVQPITLTSVLSDYRWNKISFTKNYYHLEEILKNGEFNYYGEATKEPSEITLESFSDFRPARYNYYAKNSFVYTQDLYYLNRCDNTFVVFQTGSVITPIEPYSNLLNLNYPTVATVNSPKNLVSEKEFGGYLTPINLGVSFYRGKGYSIAIDQNKLTFFNDTSAERLFLNPEKYGGRNRGLSKKDQLAPITINSIDNRWLVDSFNARERSGMIIKTQENQKMTPYQSSYEIINKNYYGLSRQNDQIDFWTNTNPAIWNDAKNYPLTLRKEIEAKTYELRKRGLLVNKGTMVQWKTDLYGNEYGLFKGEATPFLFTLPFEKTDPDFIVWLQPENIIYNSQNDVLSWNDSSDAGNDCNNFPNTTVKGFLNGYPYIGFKSPAGSQTLYTILNPNRTNNSDRYLSLISVFQTGNAGNVVNDFIPVNFSSVSPPFGYDRGLSFEDSPEGVGMHYRGGSVVIPFGDFPLLPNKWYCFCIVIDEVDKTITFYRDGSVISILPFTTSVLQPKRITGFLQGGASFASMSFENGVAEVLAFRRQLSVQEIANYQSYLTSKYNI